MRSERQSRPAGNPGHSSCRADEPVDSANAEERPLHGKCQVEEEPPLLARVVRWFDGPSAVVHVWLVVQPAGQRQQIIALQPVRRGQQPVRVAVAFALDQIDRHQQVQLLQGGVQLRPVRSGDHRIARVDHQGADPAPAGRGDLIGKLVETVMPGDHHPPLKPAAMIHWLRQRSQSQGVDIAALVTATARPVHPAGDHVQDMPQPFADGAGHVQGHAGAGDHHATARRREIPCHLFDLGSGDVAPGGEVVQVAAGDQVAQCRDPGGQIGAVGTVFEVLVQGHFHHGEKQRPVLARIDRQVQVGFLRGLGAQWVDYDDPGPGTLPRQRPLPSARNGFDPIPRTDSRIGAHQQEVVTVVDVGDRDEQLRAVHRLGHHMHRVLVHRADVEAVVTADGVEPTRQEQQVRRREAGRIPGVAGDGIRSIGFDDGRHPLCDIGDRLVPAGLDVGIAHPAHRPGDAARMLDEFACSAALGAEIPPAVRVSLVG